MEVLRLHSPAFGTVKQTMEGGVQLGEYFIPEQNVLFVSLLCLTALVLTFTFVAYHFSHVQAAPVF